MGMERLPPFFKNMDYEEKYQKGLALGGRDKTMFKALELYRQKKEQPGIIVETGTTRMKDDWGAGMSTLVFGDFCKTYNHHLFTVDIDPDALYICQDITKEFSVFISYVENDSIEFLKNFNQTIDLLYLDSRDCPEYDAPTSTNLIKSQIHQLLELEAAWDKLSNDPIILLDDNLFENGGKTRLSKVWLMEHGFTEVMSGKQSLWVREVKE